jgi:hypothetical protein
MQADGVAFITPTPENGDPSMNTLISDDVFPRVSNARSATFHLTINSVNNIYALADCDRHHGEMLLLSRDWAKITQPEDIFANPHFDPCFYAS